MTHSKFLFLLLSLALFVSCTKYDSSIPVQPDASAMQASTAIDWMEQTRKVVQAAGLNPPQASRIYAYAGMAMYEATLPGISGNRSLEKQVPLFDGLPQPKLFGKLNYEVALNVAMNRFMKTAFASSGALINKSIDSIYVAKRTTLLNSVHGPVYEASQEFGWMVGDAINRRANEDGFTQTRAMVYAVPSRSVNASFWAPTSNVSLPLEPFWGKIKCFAMSRSNECEEPMTALFSPSQGSTFYQQAFEVFTTRQTLTNEQKDIGLWWADGAGTSTPPGHWIAIASQLATTKKLSLARTTEMYALLNIALADAFISCWDAKYTYNLLRPQTYIRDYITGAANWSSLIPTPPFPEYPSGHSVSSGAAAEILTYVFGNTPFTDYTNTSLGLAPRSFQSFSQAADEAAMSRLYGGIHYRQANENGIKQGKALAKIVLKNIQLK